MGIGASRTIYRGIKVQSDTLPSSFADLHSYDWSKSGIWWTDDKNQAIEWMRSDQGFYTEDFNEDYWNQKGNNLYGLVLEASTEEENIKWDWRKIPYRWDLVDLFNSGEGNAKEYIEDEYEKAEDPDDIPYEWEEKIIREYFGLPVEVLQTEQYEFGEGEKEVTLISGANLALLACDIYELEGINSNFVGRIENINKTIQASILSPVRESLDEMIWDGDHLRPEVSEFCFHFVEDYLKNFMAEEEIPVHLQRIILIGSITGYQYDDDADIDVNILVDIDTLADNLSIEKELLIYEMRGVVGKVNGELYPGTSHPINIFLSTDESYPPADGIYDMMTDEWIKKPGHPGNVDPYSSLKDAIDRAEEIAEKVDAKWGAAQRTKAEIDRYPMSAPQITRQYLRYLKSLKRILDNVVTERREAMDLAKKLELPPPQTGIPNVVYKYLEYNGLIETLHEAARTLKRWEQTGSFTEMPSEAPVSLTEGLPVAIEGPVQMTLVEALRKDSDAPEPFIFVVSPENELTMGSRDVDGNHEKLIANAVQTLTGQSISNWQMDAYEGNAEAQEFVDRLEFYARGEFSYSTAPDGSPEPTGFFFGAFPEQAQKAYEVLQGLPPETTFDWEVQDEFDSGMIGDFLGTNTLEAKIASCVDNVVYGLIR